MLKLEDIKVGSQIEGLVPGELAEVIAVAPVGTDAEGNPSRKMD